MCLSQSYVPITRPESNFFALKVIFFYYIYIPTSINNASPKVHDVVFVF